MIIGITGSVGSGKTTCATKLSKLLSIECIHLNELALKYKEEEIKELQTFDFNLNALLEDIEKKIKEYKKEKKSLILEGHFAQFISPFLVDFLFVISRDLKYLKLEYVKRGYCEQKIRDNLEVESFNLSFYEAEEEGYQEKQIMLIDNCLDEDYLVERMLKKVKKLKDEHK